MRNPQTKPGSRRWPSETRCSPCPDPRRTSSPVRTDRVFGTHTSKRLVAGRENADFGHSRPFGTGRIEQVVASPLVEMCQPGSRPCFFRERVAGGVLRKVTSAFAAPFTLVPL